MSEIGKLRQAVEMAAQSWPPFHDGDSNSVDVYWLAQKIREVLGVVLPTELPPKNEGVLAFECVEANLLCDPQDRVLRYISVADVGQRIANLAGALKGMLAFLGRSEPHGESVCVARLHPHGKTASLRPQHSGGPGSLYATDETRWVRTHPRRLGARRGAGQPLGAVWSFADATDGATPQKTGF